MLHDFIYLARIPAESTMKDGVKGSPTCDIAAWLSFAKKIRAQRYFPL